MNAVGDARRDSDGVGGGLANGPVVNAGRSGERAVRTYVGRFAPSPSGPLHAGSLVAAMASWLDARAHGGRWLIRIEDVDEARTVPGAADHILQTLVAFGMVSDGKVTRQSQCGAAYAAAFARLDAQAMVYPCACSRREIADSLGMRGASLAPLQAAQPYPGICRHGMPAGRSARAWRVRVPEAQAENWQIAGVSADDAVCFIDRACGVQRQDLARDVGDFVLRRADGFWAYQLAVVVDDADQQVTDVVRGMDLLDSTPRQIWLQRLLGLPTPRYLHTPLVRNAAGEKLSKQTGAAALDLQDPVRMLCNAAEVLGLQIATCGSVQEFWKQALPQWAARIAPGC